MNFTTATVPGADAIRVLREFRLRYPATGEYPFLLGPACEGDWQDEVNVYDVRSPDAIVRTSRDIIPSDWIAEQRNAVRWDSSVDEIWGEWSGEILDKGSFTLHKEGWSGDFLPQVALGFARINEPWHLPAVLKFGHHNECPPPEVHCAFHRCWQQRFGAEIAGVSLTSAIIECLVQHPPATPDEAAALAWEQFWYCPDIVDQGSGDVASLAAKLLNSPYWYFWWD